jgi:L,D-transpeptidase YcbB
MHLKRFVKMKWYVCFFQIFLAFQVQAFELGKILMEKLYLHVKIDSTQKIIEVEPLKKLYELNSFNSFWTERDLPNRSAMAFREILIHAEDWGLTPADYLPQELVTLFDTVNSRNSITLEILLSDAYLKFSKDLMNGQILDPDLIDEDIKMPRKSFEVYAQLVEGAKRPENLVPTLEALAPQHEKYKNLVSVLKKLNVLKTKNAWPELVDPKIDLRPGAKHSSIVEIKRRLNDLGYPVSNLTNVYDTDLRKAVNRYQELNALSQTRTISRSFFRSLAPDLQSRIEKIKVNLEKFRWFPLKWEDRYLSINMAFQEVQVVENGNAVISMKTVNGRPTRRTPTMRDEIRRVELSPTWTVPYSIAIKDKLPGLQENPYAWAKIGIKIYDKSDNEIDPGRIDWNSIDRTNFSFTMVQQPGIGNALGLVKFPLTNPWFIYLHDTNEHHLMNQVERLRSSGCVRLEDAFKLAQYLLKDQPQWTLKEMKAARAAPLPIPVTQRLPVYMMYQTVDVTSAGEVRNANDAYGQDQRLIELFKSRGSREKF